MRNIAHYLIVTITVLAIYPLYPLWPFSSTPAPHPMDSMPYVIDITDSGENDKNVTVKYKYFCSKDKQSREVLKNYVALGDLVGKALTVERNIVNAQKDGETDEQLVAKLMQNKDWKKVYTTLYGEPKKEMLLKDEDLRRQVFTNPNSPLKGLPQLFEIPNKHKIKAYDVKIVVDKDGASADVCVKETAQASREHAELRQNKGSLLACLQAKVQSSDCSKMLQHYHMTGHSKKKEDTFKQSVSFTGEPFFPIPEKAKNPEAEDDSENEQDDDLVSEFMDNMSDDD